MGPKEESMIWTLSMERDLRDGTWERDGSPLPLYSRMIGARRTDLWRTDVPI